MNHRFKKKQDNVPQSTESIGKNPDFPYVYMFSSTLTWSEIVLALTPDQLRAK